MNDVFFCVDFEALNSSKLLVHNINRCFMWPISKNAEIKKYLITFNESI